MRYNRKELLDYIDVVSFAVVEANLYLDTHRMMLLPSSILIIIRGQEIRH